MNREYFVLTFSTYGEEEEDPVRRANNINYPEIVRHVRDEFQTFVIDAKSHRFWPVEDFFTANPKIMSFKVT